MFANYDIIVVGGGHAGCEAAHVGAQLGKKILLITMNLSTIGQMSCNPAMGGIAKGQIVREIDALGGVSGIIADKSMIQFRMLNLSKGPAMWSPRTQNDRMYFATCWKTYLEKIENIDFWQDTVKEILIKNNCAIGVKTQRGISIKSKTVILTNGTFLNGIIHIGQTRIKGGRKGEGSTTGITEQLNTLGFQSGRMKTGTPPRIDSRSINYQAMEEQKGDNVIEGFSFKKILPQNIKQKSCYITYTNPKVHEILAENIQNSPLYNGTITSKGPRYCPSIEDKIVRFKEKNRHQIFVEPEGWNTIETYINGFSTSLPEDIQYKAIKLIPGFKNAKFLKPGYAIEYDYFFPTQLLPSLETKTINQLFFAGQINGTTGYEEAACQGLMAGINAVHKIDQLTPFILSRSQAYIGVLIDDLVNKGTDEPYRMFTSRAEFRMLLRQDNADLRLTKLGYKIGLADKSRIEAVEKKEKNIQSLKKTLSTTKIHYDSDVSKEKKSIYNLLKRPEITIEKLKKMDSCKNIFTQYCPEVSQQTAIQIKYETYIDKEYTRAKQYIKFEKQNIPQKIDYDSIKALSNEGKEKLIKIRPQTLGQASRISGVSPSDIAILTLYLKKIKATTTCSI